VRVADARHHLHVIGATGSGKSTLLTQLILDDIHHGRGVVVIDPKGDLVTDITARLPAAVLRGAVLIDPDRPGPPPNLNPLTTRPAASAGSASPGWVMERALAVENLVAICRRVFAGYWGPRTDDLMRAACLTLTAQPVPRTLVDLPDLLTNPDVRARALRAISGDSVLRGFWTSYNRLSEPARAVIIAPLMNRIRALLLRPYARTLLTGHPTTASSAGLHQSGTDAPGPVDVGRVLDGGILLARIPKGSLGEEATRIVGSIIVAHTWTAATARARLPQEARKDAALVIDECHNFLNLPYSIDDLLAEARGLRLSLTLAHQNLAQLPPELRAGITANARNKLIFTVGADDARDLARHTQPHLDDYDLGHLDAFHAAARLLDHAALTPAFTLRTRPLPPPHPPR
jgi:Type IV secretion-system coupling protein DNA-binding domain